MKVRPRYELSSGENSHQNTTWSTEPFLKASSEPRVQYDIWFELIEIPSYCHGQLSMDVHRLRAWFLTSNRDRLRLVQYKCLKRRDVEISPEYAMWAHSALHMPLDYFSYEGTVNRGYREGFGSSVRECCWSALAIGHYPASLIKHFGFRWKILHPHLYTLRATAGFCKPSDSRIEGIMLNPSL